MACIDTSSPPTVSSTPGQYILAPAQCRQVLEQNLRTLFGCGVWHSKKESRILVLRESDSTGLFDRFNTFCSVRSAARKDYADNIRPSLIRKRMEEHINRTVGSFSRVATS
jgi:hypothetical protein